MPLSLLIAVQPLYGQDSLRNHYLSLPAAFELAAGNSTELALVKQEVAVAHEQTQISQQLRQPELSAGFSEGYLSNSQIWSPSFTDHRVNHLPHLATNFTLASSWTVAAGGRVRLAIQQAGLAEEQAQLSAAQRSQEVKLLVVLKYLDIYRQLNQLQIYLDNARLARRRMAVIDALYRNGKVIRNDVLRTQIEINDYELAARQTGNAVIRINTELNVVLGQPDSMRLIPDSSLLLQPVDLQPLDFYLSAAGKGNPRLLVVQAENRSAAVGLQQQKAERLPVISLYGENRLLRPYVYSIPANDVYYNVWQAGVSVKYNIASLYQNADRVKRKQLDLEVSHTRDTIIQQQVAVGVRNAYSLCLESRDQLETARRDVAFADENYRIVEKKYSNQFALITELIDAADTKIAAEIRVNDAVINILYTYYQLLQFTGSL